MDIARETRALESLARLLKEAEECRRLFDEAGMEYPGPLRRIFGDERSVSHETKPPRRGPRQEVLIPPPALTPPPGAAPGSIPVPIRALSLQSAVLMSLREAGRPLSVKQLIDAVKTHGIETSHASLANVWQRLGDRKIRRSDEGWSPADPSTAPVLGGDYVWGPSESFTVQEVAARRREAIVYIMPFLRGELGIVDIARQLSRCAWINTPVHKDLIKADLTQLQHEGKVVRTATGKWTSPGQEKR